MSLSWEENPQNTAIIPLFHIQFRTIRSLLIGHAMPQRFHLFHQFSNTPFFQANILLSLLHFLSFPKPFFAFQSVRHMSAALEISEKRVTVQCGATCGVTEHASACKTINGGIYSSTVQPPSFDYRHCCISARP